MTQFIFKLLSNLLLYTWENIFANAYLWKIYIQCLWRSLLLIYKEKKKANWRIVKQMLYQGWDMIKNRCKIFLIIHQENANWKQTDTTRHLPEWVKLKTKKKKIKVFRRLKGTFHPHIVLIRKKNDRDIGKYLLISYKVNYTLARQPVLLIPR